MEIFIVFLTIFVIKKIISKAIKDYKKEKARAVYEHYLLKQGGNEDESNE